MASSDSQHPTSTTTPSKTATLDDNYQTFRSHGTLVRLKARTGHLVASVPLSKYIFWSDLRVAFPGILRVQHEDIISTYMRDDHERRIKPFRIECVPGEVLDVIYNPSPSVVRSVATPPSKVDFIEELSSSKSTKQQQKRNRKQGSNNSQDTCSSYSTPSITVPQQSSSVSIVQPITCKTTTLTTNSTDISLDTATSTIQEQSSQQPATLKSSAVSSPSLETCADSEDYDVIGEHSTDLDSIEEIVHEVVQEQEQKNNRPQDTSSSSQSGASQESHSSPPNPASTPTPSTHRIPSFKEQEKATATTFLHTLVPPLKGVSSGSGDKTINANNENLPPATKRKRQSLLQLLLNSEAPEGSDEATKADFETIKTELLTCAHLFYAYLKSTTDYQILQAERRGRVLFATLLGLKSRIPVGHPLRMQYEAVIKDTNSTRMLFRKMRPEFLQPKADQLTGVHYGVFQHLDPKMFVILPKGDNAAAGFRLYFLCECCQLTQPDDDEETRADKKRRRFPPHQLHFTLHEGYDLLYIEEFVARFGYHMWVILQMLAFGYKDNGVAVPPMNKDSPLYKKVLCAINYIQNEPDSGKVEGSWDFSRVKDFYAPINLDKEGSAGTLFRIITNEGYAKWVCFDHYKERFPENDYKVLQAVLKRFFYNEALGALLVSLCSREEALKFYDAIVKAENLQELGLELAWHVTEEDITVLQSAILRTTAVSIKLFVPFEHHIVHGPINLKEPCRGVDVNDPNYILGHFKTRLIKHLVDCRRIQGFYMDISDPSDHPDTQESLDRLFMNTRSFADWDPDRMNPALCDMVRTAGPNAKTKLSFNSPTLERGFHFMNNAIKGDVGLVMLKAMVSYNEQVSIRSGKDEARKSMRIQRWSNSTLRFANKLERLWLEVHNHQELKALLQLIELNPCLRKLRVTTEALQFFKVYQAIKATFAAVGPSRVPKKVGLRDKADMSLTWSETGATTDLITTASGTTTLTATTMTTTLEANKVPAQPMSLTYSRKSSNVYTVLMFFGYMLTYLKCLEFSNHDAKTLEACTRSRGSHLASLQINVLGLDKKGYENLTKVIERSQVPMSQLSSHFAVYLSPIDGAKAEWEEATQFLLRFGSCVDELVLIGSMEDGEPLATFFETIKPKVLPFLEILVVVGALSKSISVGKGGIGNSYPKAVATSGFVLGSPRTQNCVKSSQVTRQFLPWLQAFVSELRLHKLGVNRLSLESSEWVALLKRIQFSDLEELDLYASRMPSEVFRNLAFFLPTPHSSTSSSNAFRTTTPAAASTTATDTTIGDNNNIGKPEDTTFETTDASDTLNEDSQLSTAVWDRSNGLAPPTLPEQHPWEMLGEGFLTQRKDYAAYKDAIEMKIGDRTDIHYRRIEAQFQARSQGVTTTTTESESAVIGGSATVTPSSATTTTTPSSATSTVTACVSYGLIRDSKRQDKLKDRPIRKFRMPWTLTGDAVEQATVRHALRTRLRGYDLE
ncbi:hypothetical protein BG015_002194 [Linnemannia schmuckeri]|uniref:Uncharacterized protein n=1 Tax=Linnemannia schmuckeri TaxID=64567 RepID=A0A9P5RNV8_9FUNG|nr:hypothetical protein BG015_002194 [Linnemannia schmuckeri]